MVRSWLIVARIGVAQAAVVIGLATAAGCRPAPPPTSAGQSPSAIKIVATSGYLQALAEVICGDGVPVTGVHEGSRPSAEAIASMMDADLILVGGAGDPAWVRAASWPRHRIVVTGEAYEDRWIELGGEDHQHGPQGQQQRGMMVAQTWMDPLLAIDQTRTVSRALAEAMPQYAQAIGDRGVAWEAELAEVDRELKAIVMGASRPSVIVAGPKYRYLIRRYGINAVEVGGEDGQIDLVAIDAALDRVNATTILVGEQLDQETLAAVASRRLKVFVLPVAVDASSGERLSGTYRRMIDLLAEIHGSSESQ